MYHFFLRRRLARVISRLNAQDYAYVKKQFAPSARHWFSGTHALSGTRSTPSRIAAWYERLATVFPGIHFTVHKLVTSGPPWRTIAILEWSDVVTGDANVEGNAGTFVVTLRWGRAVDFRIYCDTGLLSRNLAQVASRGVLEAALPPIDDATFDDTTLGARSSAAPLPA